MRHLVLALFLALPGTAPAGPLAIMPVKLLDTSHEARDQAADHARRLNLLAEGLARDLSATIIARDELTAACPHQTSDCLMQFLRDRGAERGLFVVVQKTSTLILQIFASIVEISDGKLLAHRELNFRGDNDEAWIRAGRFLARQLDAPG